MNAGAPGRLRPQADGSASESGCRALVLQRLQASRLDELQAVCARMHELMPGCAVSAVVTEEVLRPAAALGCAQELLQSAGGGRIALLRRIRAAHFDVACIVSDGGGAPGQLRSDIMALAARPRRLLWCTPGGEMRALSRTRLWVRIAGEGMLALLAFGVGAAVGVVAAIALLIAGLIGVARVRC